jgi:hypothetical protein
LTSSGLFSNPFLVFMALFVWMGAASEASVAVTRSVLGGIRVSRMMIMRFETVAPIETLQRMHVHVLAGFPARLLRARGRVVGVLPRAAW